jgi:hypothetical protein
MHHLVKYDCTRGASQAQWHQINCYCVQKVTQSVSQGSSDKEEHLQTAEISFGEWVFVWWQKYQSTNRGRGICRTDVSHMFICESSRFHSKLMCQNLLRSSAMSKLGEKLLSSVSGSVWRLTMSYWYIYRSVSQYDATSWLACWAVRQNSQF